MTEVEVIVAEGVGGEDRVILRRCEVNWSATLPPSNYTGSKKVSGYLMLRSMVSDKLIKLWIGIIDRNLIRHDYHSPGTSCFSCRNAMMVPSLAQAGRMPAWLSPSSPKRKKPGSTSI